MMTEEICDLWELPVSSCGCQKHRGKGKPLSTGVPLGKTFPAQFTSKCPLCDETIHPGEIILNNGHGYVHEECYNL